MSRLFESEFDGPDSPDSVHVVSGGIVPPRRVAVLMVATLPKRDQPIVGGDLGTVDLTPKGTLRHVSMSGVTTESDPIELGRYYTVTSDPFTVELNEESDSE